MKQKIKIIKYFKQLNINVKLENIKNIEYKYYYKIDTKINTYLLIFKDELKKHLLEFNDSEKINSQFIFDFSKISNAFNITNYHKEYFLNELLSILPKYFEVQNGEQQEDSEIIIIKFPLLKRGKISEKYKLLIYKLNDLYKNTSLSNIYLDSFFFEDSKNNIYYIGLLSHELLPFLFYNIIGIDNNKVNLYIFNGENTIKYLEQYNLLDKFIRNIFDEIESYTIHYPLGKNKYEYKNPFTF